MKVLFILGSESDKDFAGTISKHLDAWGVPSEIIVASAHKVPELVFKIVSENNKSIEKLVYITIAGRSNGLSGVTAANSIHPVIACPPFQDKVDMLVNLNSSLMMPSSTPVLTVIDPQNAAMAAIRMLGLSDPELQKKITLDIDKIKKTFEFNT